MYFPVCAEYVSLYFSSKHNSLQLLETKSYNITDEDSAASPAAGALGLIPNKIFCIFSRFVYKLKTRS